MPTDPGPTQYQTLGGEPAVRAIIDDFVERVFADVMIGFFFRNAAKARIKEMEFQLAAQMLGADIVYGGRPLDQAHHRHRIMGGQFARRKQILRETLADHGVPEAIAQRWLEHTDALRPLITGEADHECRGPGG
jgi:hemoglobin